MARSKQGGVFGFLRGKVGSMSYSVKTAKRSSTGKTEQVVRALPEQVSNPQTASQAMQRMKLAPAQRFYKAFSELLGNAFQGVEYGEKSRQYFLSKALSAEGPYIQKSVDRFIPAAYQFSEGSLPSVGIMPFNAGDTVITLEATTDAAEVTPEVLAAALRVSLDTQITVAVCNNVNGLFVPSYIPFSDRLKIQDLPAGTLNKTADGNITISPAALSLNAEGIVAACVVLSRQDVGGTWLRSTQEMIINEELRQSLYSTAALEAAIYSYQDTEGAANAINNEWYYNLGMAQPWGGKLIINQVDYENKWYPCVVGVKQVAGRVKSYYFYKAVDGEDRVVLAIAGNIVTQEGITKDVGLWDSFPYWEEWDDSYAAQLGFITGAE